MNNRTEESGEIGDRTMNNNNDNKDNVSQPVAALAAGSVADSRRESPSTMARIKEIMRHAQRVGSELQRWSDAATHLTKQLKELCDPEECDNKYLQCHPNLYCPDVSEEVDASIAKWNQMLETKLKFFELCHDLQQNSPTVQKKVEINRDVCPDGYLRYLGDAMLHSTHVNELSVAVVSLHFPIDDMQNIQSLVEYIQTSSTLRKVTIDVEDYSASMYESAVQLANIVLHAVAANTYIQELHYTGWAPPAALHNVLSTASLKTLGMDCAAWRYHSEDDFALILNGFSSNHTIENLDVTTLCTLDWNQLDAILHHIADGHAKLRKLYLRPCFWGPRMLRERLLCLTSLQYLELWECRLSDDSLDRLIEGIQFLDVAWSSRTKTQLSFCDCSLTDEGKNKLIKFVTTRICNRNHQEGVLLHKPNFVNIQYSLPHLGPLALQNGFAIVTESSKISTASSGSLELHHCSLSLLCSSWNGHCVFSKTMASAVNNISLVCLQLTRAGPNDCVELAHCLPQLVTLRALHLVEIRAESVLPTTLWNGLRQNGSLFESSFQSEGKRPFFQENQLRLVQAYHKRNRVVIEMTSTESAFWSNLHPDSHGNHNVDDSRARVSLLPKLLHAANPMTFTRPRFALAALLVLNSTVGPHEQCTLVH